MKNLKALLIFMGFCLANVTAFGQDIEYPKALADHYPGYIDACELLDHKNEVCYTRFVYSGVDEYWSLTPLKKCTKINAELDFAYNVKLTKTELAKLKKVQEKYWKYYLIIDAVGLFEISDKKGYGHLGTNTSKFTVTEIIDIYLKEK